MSSTQRKQHGDAFDMLEVRDDLDDSDNEGDSDKRIVDTKNFELNDYSYSDEGEEDVAANAQRLTRENRIQELDGVLELYKSQLQNSSVALTKS
jgi:hypothetical protein